MIQPTKKRTLSNDGLDVLHNLRNVVGHAGHHVGAQDAEGVHVLVELALKQPRQQQVLLLHIPARSRGRQVAHARSGAASSLCDCCSERGRGGAQSRHALLPAF